MPTFGDVEVVSFDVFETVLVRSVAEPSSVFLLLGRALARAGHSELSAEVFARARFAAERRARRRAGPHRDPTLADIHTELLDAVGDRLDATALRDGELDLERALLRPNPLELRWLAAARDRGLPIVFTSDTYLPGAFLREVLAGHDLAAPGDLVLASCEHGATKHDGTLFDELVRRTGCPPARILHRGNHPVSDVSRARRAGLAHGELAMRGNLTADEDLLESHRFPTAGLSSVLAGAARLGRLTTPARSRREQVLRAVAADIAAPTVIAYVLWVLHRARHRGLDRLYFLSREGQLLAEVAGRLVARLGWDLDVRYLLGSRLSLNLAACRTLDATELAWTLTHVETNSVAQLLGRVGLDATAWTDVLGPLGIGPEQLDEVPDASRRLRILEAITDGPLRGPVLAAAQRVREPVTRYLEEIGFLDEVAVGLVDTSGIGSQFHALARLRVGAGRTPPAGFLAMRDSDRRLAALGAFDGDGGTDTDADPAAATDANTDADPAAATDAATATATDAHRAADPGTAPDVTIDAWLDDEVRGTGGGKPPGGAALLEIFCTADHGTITGYALDGAGAPVVHGAPPSEAQEAWGAPLVRATVLAVADALHLDARHVDPAADARDAVRALLHRFWHTPTPDEARVWAAFPLAPATSVEPERRVASPYHPRDVARALRRGAVADEAWYSWRQASLVLSPAPVRATIRSARWLKTRAGRTVGRLRR